MEVKMESTSFETTLGRKFPYYAKWVKIPSGAIESVEFLNVHIDKLYDEHSNIRKIQRNRKKLGGNKEIHIY